MEAERSVGNSQRSHNMILSQYLAMIWYYCNMLSITIHIAFFFPHLPSLARDTPLLRWLTSSDRERTIKRTVKSADFIHLIAKKLSWYLQSVLRISDILKIISSFKQTITILGWQTHRHHSGSHPKYYFVLFSACSSPSCLLALFNNSNLIISVRYLPKIFQWSRWNDTTTKTWHTNKSHEIIYLMTVQAW